MEKRIVFEILGAVKIFAPAGKYIYKTDSVTNDFILDEDGQRIVKETIEDIAIKVVPKDAPFWIVDVADIPTDRTYRGAWELSDMPEPDGYGE